MTRREALLIVALPAGQSAMSDHALSITDWSKPRPWIVHLPPSITVVCGDQRVTYTDVEIMAALTTEAR